MGKPGDKWTEKHPVDKLGESIAGFIELHENEAAQEDGHRVKMQKRIDEGAERGEGDGEAARAEVKEMEKRIDQKLEQIIQALTTQHGLFVPPQAEPPTDAPAIAASPSTSQRRVVKLSITAATQQRTRAASVGVSKEPRVSISARSAAAPSTAASYTTAASRPRTISAFAAARLSSDRGRDSRLKTVAKGEVGESAVGESQPEQATRARATSSLVASLRRGVGGGAERVRAQSAACALRGASTSTLVSESI